MWPRRRTVSCRRSREFPQPSAKYCALIVGHLGLVAQRHGLGLNRLGENNGSIFFKVGCRFQDDIFRRFLEALVRGLCRVTHDAVFARNSQRFGIGNGIRNGEEPKSAEKNRYDSDHIKFSVSLSVETPDNPTQEFYYKPGIGADETFTDTREQTHKARTLRRWRWLVSSNHAAGKSKLGLQI